MQVMPMGEFCLKITLSGPELERLRISFDSFKNPDDKTRAVLTKLLALATGKTGFAHADCELFIEIYPEDEGAVSIIFSVAPPDAPRAGEPAFYCFDDVDMLVSAAAKMHFRFCHRVYKTSLYSFGESLFLVVYPLDTIDGGTLSLLREYAQQSGFGSLGCAFIEEHARAISISNAVDEIAKYMM